MKVARLTANLGAVVLGVAISTAVQAKTSSDEVKSLARCIAKKDRVQTRALVLSVPGSAEESSRLAAMSQTFASCGALSYTGGNEGSTALLIGALAEPISTSWGEISGRWQGVPDRDKLAQSSSKRTVAYPVNAAVARCLFDTYPDEGEDFVRARPGSKRQTRAFSFLQGAITRCVDTGMQISMTKPQFQAEMVRAYVRYVCVPNDPTPLVGSFFRKLDHA